MAVFSATYILGAIALYGMQLGDASLVYANILNLSIRILYSAHFTSSFFARRGARDVLRWKSVMPTWPVLLIAGVSNTLIRIAGRRLDVLAVVASGGRKALVTVPVATYVALGGSLALTCLGTWWMSSGRYLNISRRSKTE
jgi:oligosaccharide translocation protein RFT1